MNDRDVAQRIGCCGRLCSFCKEAVFCEGCHSREGKCARHTQLDGCYQYSCAHRKHLAGCWECDAFPCDKDMFLSEDAIYLKAFNRCIIQEGIDKFSSYAFLAYIKGKSNEDFHSCKSEEEVLCMLKGKKQKITS